MSDHDDDARTGDEVAANPGWSSRRKRAAAGAVGLAALLGAGAYLITAQVIDRNDHTTNSGNAGALAPIVTSASSEPTAAAQAVTPEEPPKAPNPSPSRSMSVEEQIKAARSAAAKDGHPLQRALTPAPGIKAATDVVERNEKVENGSLRVITARSDLTGQRELLWAADKGKRYGDATCTKNIKFANNAGGSIRPNLLLCWRVSETRSVATVLIDYGGHPSTAKSEEVIDREWAKLG